MIGAPAAESVEVVDMIIAIPKMTEPWEIGDPALPLNLEMTDPALVEITTDVIVGDTTGVNDKIPFFNCSQISHQKITLYF